MSFLRENTEQYINFGPFLDVSNGATVEIGEGGTGMDVYISKDGAAYALKNSGTLPSHDRAGHYRVHLDATDTNTPGVLRVNVSDPTVHLDVTSEYFVADTDYYDTITGSIVAPANITQVSTTAVTAVSDFHADLSSVSTFNPDADQVFLKGTTHDGSIISQVTTAGSASVVDIDTTTLAKFANTDTGEGSASVGSVAALGQGNGTGGAVTVGGFSAGALQALIQTDTGLTSANSGSVAKISQGASGLDAGTVEQACEDGLVDLGYTAALASSLSNILTSGSGAHSKVVTVTDAVSDPIAGAEVWVSTDSAGDNIIAGVLTTNTSGQVTFYADAGTYYAWIDAPNYNESNPYTITVP